MSEPKRHHVRFRAEKVVPKPVQVEFRRPDGTEASFPAHKKVKVRGKVDFMAKNRKKWLVAHASGFAKEGPD